MQSSQSNKDKHYFNLRLNDESGEERDVRLEQMRELTRDRRAAQSSEQREATLLHVREQMRDRLATESEE